MTDDKVFIKPLWNKTERPQNQIEVPTNVLKIRVNTPSQTGIEYQVKQKSGAKVWLDSAWFMEL